MWGHNYRSIAKSEAMTVYKRNLSTSCADLNAEYQMEPNT